VLPLNQGTNLAKVVKILVVCAHNVGGAGSFRAIRLATAMATQFIPCVLYIIVMEVISCLALVYDRHPIGRFLGLPGFFRHQSSSFINCLIFSTGPDATPADER
jgi:hypothetical protein